MNGYYLMQPINQSIYRILIDDRITEEEAVEVSANPEEYGDARDPGLITRMLCGKAKTSE